MGRDSKLFFCWNYLFGQVAVRSFVQHVVGVVKSDAQEKLSVILTFSGFIELCRINTL